MAPARGFIFPSLRRPALNGSFTAIGNILFRRSRHSFEGVKKIKVPVANVEGQQCPRNGHHTAPFPNPALDDIARDVMSHYVFDGAAEGGYPLQRCFRIIVYARKRVDILLCDIRRKGPRISHHIKVVFANVPPERIYQVLFHAFHLSVPTL